MERIPAAHSVSFLTPYWSGREMMRLHLDSIRRFYPAAPILVSRRGGGREEMEAHRAEFGIEYWLEDCDYIDSLLRLLERCATELVGVLDHDTVLLSSLDSLLDDVRERRYDLVGIEERIREAPGVDWVRIHPENNGWLRFAPGLIACNFILFNWREFRQRWGLRGVRGKRPSGSKDFEYDYGVSQRLKRHKYLLPFHTRKYGLGNLLKDGETPILWHQWYGSHGTRLESGQPDGRLPQVQAMLSMIEAAERAFLADYPNLDLKELIPAWGPDCDIEAERRARAERNGGKLSSGLRRLRQWRRYGARGLAARAGAKLDRWWRTR